MTATDELRRLLDERDVEWTANDGEYVKETCWTYMGELTAAFAEYYDGTTRFDCDMWCFTPAQAIAATLGRGTCRECAGMEDVFECSECGMRYEGWALKRWARYCPNCGRKVVDA